MEQDRKTDMQSSRGKEEVKNEGDRLNVSLYCPLQVILTETPEEATCTANECSTDMQCLVHVFNSPPCDKAN